MCDSDEVALVVILRGVNVGGHRTFRPSLLAKAMSDHDVVNVGAAGTFVVRRPGSRSRLRAELLRRLPFDTEIAICDGRDLVRLVTDDPFGSRPPRSGVVRFVSVLSGTSGVRATASMRLPAKGEWLVQGVGAWERVVFGEERRHMKTIGYLGRLDRLLGATATTRNWNTILAVVRILEGEGKKRR